MGVFDEYEQRFAEARANHKSLYAWDEASKEKIIQRTGEVLGYREEWVPEIRNMEEISEERFSNYCLKQLRYISWKNFYVSASLYLPDTGEEDAPLPLVFLLCGHGADGRLSKSYVYMAHRLVKLGIAVLVPDNIGQGDRIAQGHTDCVTPFYCGVSLQGMIVMETIALIRFMRRDTRFDPKRFASCGNSGGGTLNVFLAALAPELCALSASGYPSEFSYILAKERRHCCCNLLPGIAQGPEMWEILSVFAPKPLFLEQGENDSLIPYDLAHRNARKVQNVYVQMNAADRFGFVSTKTTHPWASDDRYAISKFLAKALGAKLPEEGCDEDPELICNLDKCHVALPENGFVAAEVAERLTGIRMPENTQLKDIYPPRFRGRRLSPEKIMPDIGRGDLMRVFAQMECTFHILNTPKRS